ncbi:Retrovirus-related Pol polyprotein from transposon TNT 1-94 [Bienertia sinuspersici]
MDSTNPLYLHPSDGCNTIAVEKLEGSNNYRGWKRSMEIALASKRKLGLVTGVIVRDKSDPVKQEAWDTCNNMVISWILGNVSESIKRPVMFMSTAKDMWRSLEQRFQISNGARRYQISKQIYETKQNGKNVNEYYTEMKILWEELDNLISYPPITEINPEVAAYLHAKHQQEEEQKLFQFLNGLDEINGAIRSQLLMHPTLPSADEACCAIQQEEAQRDTLKPVKEEQETLVMYGKSSGPTCTACGKNGHIREKCWTIVGYPPWHSSGEGRGRGRDNTGGRGGRAMRGSRGRGRASRGGGWKMAASAQYQKGESSQTARENAGGTGTGITAEQLEQLLKLLPTPSKQGGEDPDEELDCNYAGMVTCYSASLAKSKWILDSGATHHMTGDFGKLRNTCEVNKTIRIGLPTGDTAMVTHKGDARLNDCMTLENVMYVPTFKHNLISIQKLVKDSKCEVKFTENFCIIKEADSECVKGIGRAERGLYILLDGSVSAVRREMAEEKTKREQAEVDMRANTVDDVVVPGSIKMKNKVSEEMLWHQRLGHAPLDRIQKIEELKEKVKNCNEECLICPQAKFTRQPYLRSNSRASDVFELIHIDIWGPYKVPTRRGHRFFLTMVDDYSRTTWVHLMKQKSQASEVIKELVNQAETQFGKTVKKVRSDNALEFEDRECRLLYLEKGIVHQTSCVDRPQQNGRVERRHRNILEMARALRMQGGLPLRLWGDSVLAAVYITNRLPTSVLGNKSPYEVLYNKLPNYKCMRSFGCLVMSYNPDRNHDKFKSRGVPCIFIGYPQNKKGYKLLNLTNNTVLVSRDVRFYEEIYPYKMFNSPRQEINEHKKLMKEAVHVEDGYNVGKSVEEEENVIVETNQEDGNSENDEERTEMVQSELEEKEVRRSQRAHKTPLWMGDYYVGNVKEEKCPKKIRGMIDTDVSESFSCFVAQSEHVSEPKFFKEAVKERKWVDAMNEELDALELNETWKIVDLPEGKTPIGCKWLYKIKYKSDGNIERYKARLVVLGNKQKYGEDYDETFAPVAKMTTLRS